MKKFYICIMFLLFSIKGFTQFSEYGGTYYDSQYGMTGVNINGYNPGPNWAAINAANDAYWAAQMAAIAANIPQQPNIPPPIPPPPSSPNPISVGSSTQQSSQPYVAQINDKLAKPNIPVTMPRQVLNTCVSSIMEYLSKIYGQNIDSGVFERYYLEKFNVFLIIDGVDYLKMTAFAQNFFETANYVGIKPAIDTGNFLMTNLNVGNNIYHNVLIVGYHPNGDYIYMDPIYGNLREAPPSNFPQNYVVTIKNSK